MGTVYVGVVSKKASDRVSPMVIEMRISWDGETAVDEGAEENEEDKVGDECTDECTQASSSE